MYVSISNQSISIYPCVVTMFKRTTVLHLKVLKNVPEKLTIKT